MISYLDFTIDEMKQLLPPKREKTFITKENVSNLKRRFKRFFDLNKEILTALLVAVKKSGRRCEELNKESITAFVNEVNQGTEENETGNVTEPDGDLLIPCDTGPTEAWRDNATVSDADIVVPGTLSVTELMQRQFGNAWPIINSIVSSIGGNTDLAHDGSSSYSEPTLHSVLRIASALKPLLGDNRDRHVLMDTGAGLGTALWILCNALGIKGVGIEDSANRLFLGSSETVKFLNACKNKAALQHKVVNCHGNLLALRRLPSYVSVVYMFDLAFSPALMYHLIDLYAKAPLTLRFVITSKQEYAKEFRAKHFYPLLPNIPCKMIRSRGRNATFTVYGRHCCDYSDLVGKVFPPPDLSSGLSEGADEVDDDVMESVMQDYQSELKLPPEVEQVLMHGDVEAATQYYIELEDAMQKLMSRKRRRLGKASSESFSYKVEDMEVSQAARGADPMDTATGTLFSAIVSDSRVTPEPTERQIADESNTSSSRDDQRNRRCYFGKPSKSHLVTCR